MTQTELAEIVVGYTGPICFGLHSHSWLIGIGTAALVMIFFRGVRRILSKLS